MVVNGYEIQGELNNANSGFSKWGFAVKNRHIYFIKELITPVYPIDEAAMSGELLAQKRAACHEFEQRYKKVYNSINSVSCGNLVRIVEFFRWGGKYYIVTERAGNNALTVSGVAALPDIKKYFLMKSAAYAFACFHHTGLVHFDVKPTNIIIKETANKMYVAKLIDFDAGFFKEEIREDIELGGDLTYLAPESFLHILGEEIELTEKVDIFALGLVFHEYYCGKLPDYNTDEYDYLYEAALDKGVLELDYDKLPEKLGKMIGAMLSVDPTQRPSAQEIVGVLSEIIAEETGIVSVVAEPTTAPEVIVDYGESEAAEVAIDATDSTPTGAESSENSHGTWFTMGEDL